MATKKKQKTTLNPFHYNDAITVFYEMKHGRDEIIIGTPLRFKYERGTFKFLKLVHNEDKGVTWIDCMDTKNGTFRSFYVSKLVGVVKPKNKRKKRVASV